MLGQIKHAYLATPLQGVKWTGIDGAMLALMGGGGGGGKGGKYLVMFCASKFDVTPYALLNI